MAPRPTALSRPSERHFYHATTASARAAELAAASHRPRAPFAAPPTLRAQRAAGRHPMAQLPLQSADKPPRPSSSSSSAAAPSHKRVRVVLEKRLIRGSAVFRAPTEQDIDEYLRLESSRQMLTCASATVDLPPTHAAAPLCARCARALPAANPSLPPLPPRLASLLAKALPDKSPLDVSSAHAPLDMTQLAMLDEYTAVAMFLRRLRAQRSSMLFSVRARHVYPADKLSTVTVRKPQPSQTRSLSADNPALMLPSSPPILISTPAAAQDNSASCVPPLLFENPRARSELLPSPPSVSDTPSATPTSRHAPSTLTNFSAPRMHSSSKSPPMEPRRRHTRHAPDEHDDDDTTTTTTAAPLRILTAIEPVDPAGALEHAQLCRGASYHVGATGLDLPLFRRRRRTSGADHGDNGFLNKLQRLRSFRRRPDSWASIVRRFSTQHDVNAR
ncbi:serine/arginine repetitive matrix protein [Gracilaria domingensis]|nr:serine/arginine repetitive matrix protein [Gracilaria domingensis]